MVYEPHELLGICNVSVSSSGGNFQLNSSGMWVASRWVGPHCPFFTNVKDKKKTWAHDKLGLLFSRIIGPMWMGGVYSVALDPPC
jgi:hypothetical protein